MENKHQCPATGCHRMLSARIALCKKHWNVLSGDTQDKIRRAWSEEQRRYPMLSASTGYATLIYDAVKEIDHTLESRENARLGIA